MILVLRADSPDVIVGIHDGNKVIAEKNWHAGRELSTQILQVIDEICNEANTNKRELDGIIVYEGPGSYTGLRISISVGNALAYAHNLPIVGSTSDDWIASGLQNLKIIDEFAPISPVYGGEVFTTKPRK